MNNEFVDPQAEDRELKGQLLRKYSGYLGSLKQEFMKKRKKGKLPKEARQQLLDWWSRHYKWPYPSVNSFLILAIMFLNALHKLLLHDRKCLVKDESVELFESIYVVFVYRLMLPMILALHN